MSRTRPVEDPKVAVLRESRCLNPHPETVTDPQFADSDFFDPRDSVQVKYEMIRAVRAGQMTVTAAAAAYGYSRPAYYTAAAALDLSGLDGLVPAKPGPHGGHKLTAEILSWVEVYLVEHADLKPAGLVDPIEVTFGVHLHPRTIERGLDRWRHQSKSR
jgi:transposase